MFGGGGSGDLEYSTIASTGNGTDFGNLSVARNNFGATASTVTAMFSGGNSNGNVIDTVTIATTGNASDFGDLTVARAWARALSDNHGGVQ